MIEIKITYENGQVQLAGNVQDPVVILGILQLATLAIGKNMGQDQPRVQPARLVPVKMPGGNGH